MGINSFWLLLARLGSQILMLVFTALIARRLGEAGFGQFTFIAAIVFLGNVFTTFGTDTLLIREIARTRDATTQLVSTAFWIQIALSILFVSALFIFANGAIALPLYALSLFPLAFFTIYSAILRAFERMDLYLRLNLAASVLQTISAIIVFVAQADLIGLIVALLICQIVTALFAGILCHRRIHPLRIEWRIPSVLAPTLRAALPFAMLTTFAVIYQRMGVLTLATLSGDDTTGWFSAASRIIEAIKLAPQALLGALFPMLAHSIVGEDSARLIRASTGLSISFSVIAIGICAMLAQPIITFVYGNRFLPSISALPILALSLIPYALTANLTLALVAQGREWLVLGGTVAALSVALLLFALLVPRAGLVGACWATVISEVFQAALFVVLKTRGVTAKRVQRL